MINPYAPPSNGADLRDRNARAWRVHVIGLWVGGLLLTGLALCICFTIYLFVGYPMLEDATAVANEDWPLESLRILAKFAAAFSIAGGVTIGLSVGLRRLILAKADSDRAETKPS